MAGALKTMKNNISRDEFKDALSGLRQFLAIESPHKL